MVDEADRREETVERVTSDLAQGGAAVAVEAAVEAFEQLAPADQAEVLLDLPTQRRLEVIDAVDDREIAEFLPELDEQELETVLAQLTAERLGRILDLTPADTAADALQALDEADIERVLTVMSSAAQVRPLLGYDEDDAGGIMLPNVVALRESITAAGALSFLRRTRPSAESVYYIYVVDAADRLIGVVGLRELIIAQPGAVLIDVMDRHFVSVHPDTDKERCARLLQRYNLLALPVVDRSGRLVGSITVDEVMDVAEEEATEDMYRMVGVAADERPLGPIHLSIRRRLPWLAINLVTAFTAAAVIGLFEATIAAVAILAAFQTIVAGEGGNAGTQGVTVIVRSLALGEIELADGGRLLLREGSLGVINGLVIGLATGVVAFLWQGQAILGLIVALAMLLNLVVAGLAGAAVPLFLKTIRVDPALASTVIVTTLTDIGGFFFFLGLATLFLPFLLP